MNVQPGEIAILINTLHQENKLRICQVIGQIIDKSGYSDQVWWVCEFPRPVKTQLGWMHFACILDDDLQRISERCKRFSYPATHYQLMPVLAQALASTRNYREASA